MDPTCLAAILMLANDPPRPLVEVSLRPSRRYIAPDAPITIEVDGSTRPGLTVQVLDSIGQRVGTTIPGAPAIDLRDAFTPAQAPERAVFVQAFIGDEAVGSPLVLEPLRAAPACRTVRATGARARGPYTKVVGWGSS
ncbi:MAG: hypothetical protein ACKPEA_01180, partial [Planctomycetota bacterium]